MPASSAPRIPSSKAAARAREPSRRARPGEWPPGAAPRRRRCCRGPRPLLIEQKCFDRRAHTLETARELADVELAQGIRPSCASSGSVASRAAGVTDPKRRGSMKRSSSPRSSVKTTWVWSGRGCSPPAAAAGPTCPGGRSRRPRRRWRAGCTSRAGRWSRIARPRRPCAGGAARADAEAQRQAAAPDRTDWPPLQARPQLRTTVSTSGSSGIARPSGLPDRVAEPREIATLSSSARRVP